jgi:hypothetical protein
LDDVHDFDSELAEALASNTRRYVGIASDVVHEILPDYKEREVRSASRTRRDSACIAGQFIE